MTAKESYLIPNLVIGGRVALAFVAVGMLALDSPGLAWGAVVLTVVVIAMDGLDGYLARRLGLASELGAVVDITADRIVEHIFWIAFAVFGQVGLWVPLVVMTRSFVVDAGRGLALAHGKTAFGDSTMMRSAVSRFLTGSRFMRTTYAAAKTVAFVLLGAEVAVERSWAAGAFRPAEGAFALLAGLGQAAVWVAVVLCVVRGIPVVADSRAYLVGPPADTGGRRVG